ncbi:MAG: endonuclease/exonuclease/phosphatase family protein [Halioglobus sp.]
MRAGLIFALPLLPVYIALGGCGNDSNNNNGSDSAPAATVTVANLNILHGFDCDPPTPADGDQCRVRDRVALLGQHLIADGCPDLVTLQEIVNKEYVQRSPTEQAGPLDSLVTLITAELPNLARSCGFTYELVYQPFLPAAVAETDEELILSRYPVVQTDTRALHSAMYDETHGFLIFARHLLHARIEHPTGTVDLYTTHLSSGSDSATNNCTSFRELVAGTGIGPQVACPPECDSQDTVRACQARQLALYVEQTRGAHNLGIISGDFNAVPGSSEYQEMTGRGWLDSHTATGQPACDGTTGIGCTTGRDAGVGDLEQSALNVDARIDYIFVVPPDNQTCVASLASGQQGRYAIIDAGLFAGAPNPFAKTCGAPPEPICWVSDHSGNRASLRCQP